MVVTTSRKVLIAFSAVLLIGCNLGTDTRDAQETASRIHHQFTSGDFASIYRESTPHFKQLDEKNFISSLQQMRQEYGVMQEAKVLAYQSGVDSNAGRTHAIISDLQFEKAHARERMVLARAEDGRMRLWDLIIEPK